MTEQEIQKIKEEAIKEFQSKGGQTRKAQLGKKGFSEMGKKGMEVRWKNKKIKNEPNNIIQ
jgi:hypothetical protein